MLTRTATTLIYWAEAVTYVPTTLRTVSLGTHRAASPRLALRWLRHRAARIADQLDAQDAALVRHWLTDEHEHACALTRLTDGASYTFISTTTPPAATSSTAPVSP